MKKTPARNLTADGHLLSYPRSGNHIVRALIEHITHRATLGCVGSTEVPFHKTHLQNLVHVQPANKPSFQKCHFVREINVFKNSPQTKLILLLRHPKECIFSQMKGVPAPALWNQELQSYMNNINLYLGWSGPKHIIFYEDLIHQVKKSRNQVIRELATFLGASAEDAEHCIENWDNLSSQTKQFLRDHTATDTRVPKSFGSLTFYRDLYGAKSAQVNTARFTDLLKQVAQGYYI